MSNDAPFGSIQRISPDLQSRGHLRKIIAGAVAEVDLAQVAVSRRLTPAQRVAQAASMIRAAESAAAYRLRQLDPNLSEREALLIVRQGGIIEYRRRQREQSIP